MNCILNKDDNKLNFEAMDKSDLVKIVTDIKEALLREHPLATKHDEALIKQEEVTRVLLGLGLTDPIVQSFSGRPSRNAKLRSSISELTDQINKLQGSALNTLLLRAFYVLMLNGRGNEVDTCLKRDFPEYFQYIS